MQGSGSPRRPDAQFIDWLFSQLPGVDPGYGEAAPGLAVTSPTFSPHLDGQTGPAAIASWAGPQPPPALKDSSDLQAAYQWLLIEKQRLDEYTRIQFNALRQQHQAVLTKHFRSEEALALRSQELNREIQFLASQTAAFQKRAQELVEREMLLASQMERLSQAQKELLAIEQTGESGRQETEEQQARLEKLRSETAQLQSVEASARVEFSSFETGLRDRQKAWEQKQEEIRVRLAQMEERYLALERAEAAAQRRLAELDELEQRLQREFADQARPDLQTHQLQLQQRYLDLERAEAAAQRRLAELDDLEERLRQEFAQQAPTSAR
jgi:hypothetical protein